MRYNPDFLSNLDIADKTTKQQLEELSSAFLFKEFLTSGRLIEKMGFDFIYSSSQIEGNTYTKADTLVLLDDGITAGGKKYTDAKMILNLRDAYNEILFKDNIINKTTLHKLHSIISLELVNPKNCGYMRNINLKGITGTNYIPLAYGERLSAEMDFLFEQYNKIENPFEKSIYLHNNLCYLQYFEDCNKRTARAMQFLSLKNSEIMPLVIIDDNKKRYSEYRSSIVNYYDTGEHKAFVDFFINAYKQEFEYLNEIKNLSVDEILEDKTTTQAGKNNTRRMR